MRRMSRKAFFATFLLVALLIAGVGSFYASTHPDGLNFVAENAQEISAKYGNAAKASIAAVQRQLLMLENQGADKFFGEPALDLHDFLKVDRDGRGTINVLAADKLMAKPRLYASFLLWMLSELFEELPEVGGGLRDPRARAQGGHRKGVSS